jgi:hypothetical protein
VVRHSVDTQCAVAACTCGCACASGCNCPHLRLRLRLRLRVHARLPKQRKLTINWDRLKLQSNCQPTSQAVAKDKNAELPQLVAELTRKLNRAVANDGSKMPRELS